MRNLIIITILFFNTICQAQVPIGDDDLSEIYKRLNQWEEERAEYDYEIPNFKAGLLYYKILSQYSDSIVEVYSCPGSCNEDPFYSQLDTCIVPDRVIYKGKTYIVKGIGFGAFYNCSRLKKVVLPNTITYIAHGNFMYCDSIMNLNIPMSVKRIGPSNWGMNSYVQSLYEQLPDSIERVRWKDINPW